MSTNARMCVALLASGIAMSAGTSRAGAGIIQTNTDATVAASGSDLLQTQLESSSQPGQWAFVSGSSATRTPVGPLLTNGTACYPNTTFGTPAYANGTYGSQYTMGNTDNQVTFTLNTTVNTLGYDITGVDFYHGWSDNGRDAISFIIAVSTVSAPSTFTTLYTTTSYDPPANYGRQSVTENSSGVLATGVKSVRITIAGAENSGTGVSEIDVFGNATGAAVPEPASLGILSCGAALMLMRRRRLAARGDASR